MNQRCKRYRLDWHTLIRMFVYGKSLAWKLYIYIVEQYRLRSPNVACFFNGKNKGNKFIYKIVGPENLTQSMVFNNRSYHF